MPKLVALSALNATTLDILNVIRSNASFAYRDSVPEVTEYTQLPVVGSVIYGTPALANEFINSLVNRIALVRAKSLSFNNPFRWAKKGYLEYGETIEEIFVEIAKANLYKPDEAYKEELRRTMPDVKAAFHAINWKVKYPLTIQDDDLRQAFLTPDGVTDLIARIVDSVYKGAEYDEYLLIKYMIIKGYNANDIKRVVTAGTMDDYAISFRSLSNQFLFPSKKFNAYPVKNNCPRERQHIIMAADFNAAFDVSVLASAFNMEKADFVGQLTLVDDFTSFDNERFAEIVAESNSVELVTEEELTAMGNVKAMLMDEEWFQIYDNLAKMTEAYVASGLYWNYFYHNWKTVSWSPFANAVAFEDNGNL